MSIWFNRIVRMAARDSQPRFTSEQDEQIIDLVRNNDCFHKVSDKQFKNNDHKHRLWSELAAKQNRDGESSLESCFIFFFQI